MKTAIKEDNFSQNNTQKEKIIVDTKIEYNCEQSIIKYYIDSNKQNIFRKISNFDFGPMQYVLVTAILSALGLGFLIVGFLIYQCKKQKEENTTLIEDYIIFDKKIILYDDGSTEIQKINIKNQTRIVPISN